MLESEKILLRALEPDDVDALFLWENDRKNWRVSQTLVPYSRHVLTSYINSVTDIYTDKQLRLIIQRKEDNLPLGTIDLFDCDFKNKRAGIGVLIARAENRDHGYASEALALVLDYCENILGLHQVYCNVLEDNQSSIHLFKKFGFEECGRKQDWIVHQGVFYDEILMQRIFGKKS
jgi:diamine N-acetyltransferase